MAKRPSLINIHRLIQEATTTVPPEQSFVAELKTVIEKIDMETSRPPSKSYKPSSMTCIRNMYFQKVGEERDDERSNACLIGMAQTGSARHDHLQSAVARMKDFGVDCEYIDVAEYVKQNNLDYLEIVGQQGHETKLYHKILNLSFLCDGIIKYKGEYFILEIKTETIYKWQSRDGVAEEHYAQGTCYSTCFNINKVLFLYENRDSTDKKAYVLEVTDDMKYDLVLSKIEECDSYVNKLIPPPKPKELPRKICDYCRYKTACRKAGN